MKKHLLLAAITLFLIIIKLPAQTITLMAEGTKQGKFKGESTRPKFSDKCDITGYVQEIISPRDVATGLATGKNNFQPIIILKKSGAASPQFLQALTTNEILKKVIIDFYKPDPSGQEVNYYSVTLENASISGYKQFIGPLENEKFNPDNSNLYDEIKFVFQKITVEDKINKTITTADWSTNTRF